MPTNTDSQRTATQMVTTSCFKHYAAGEITCKMVTVEPKSMPQLWDGKYRVIAAHPESSMYRIDFNGQNKKLATFHASQQERNVANDAEKFPNREHTQPPPILTKSGLNERVIDNIIDQCRRGPKDDEWLPRRELEECEALDAWLAKHGDQ